MAQFVAIEACDSNQHQTQRISATGHQMIVRLLSLPLRRNGGIALLLALAPLKLSIRRERAIAQARWTRAAEG